MNYKPDTSTAGGVLLTLFKQQDLAFYEVPKYSAGP